MDLASFLCRLLEIYFIVNWGSGKEIGYFFVICFGIDTGHITNE